MGWWGGRKGAEDSGRMGWGKGKKARMIDGVKFLQLLVNPSLMTTITVYDGSRVW